MAQASSIDAWVPKMEKTCNRARKEGNYPKKMVAGRHVSDKKEAVAFHDTGCFIGIFIINGFFYYNLHIAG